MMKNNCQLYGVALPSRERRLAIVAIVGLAAWSLSLRGFRSAEVLSAWAGMASLWFS